MKNILYLLLSITLFSSCKSRELLSKATIKQYNLTDETLIGTEVYITDPVRMIFDSISITPDNCKGFISVKQTHIVDKVKIRLQCKGRIEVVDHIGNRLLLGVLFEKKAQPIYFIMNKQGYLELYLIKNMLRYNEHNYELVSSNVPYLEVIIKRNEKLSKSKMIMTGY